jgi:SAM-dependent methyltransferase
MTAPAPRPGAAALSLVCPTCHAALQSTGGTGMRCLACGADFPPRAGVPVLLSDDEWRACRAHLDEEAAAREGYARARREAPLTLRYFDWWVGRMLAEIPDHLDGPFVELMCGGAEVCRRLPARFTSALALDLDVDMVEQAAADLRAAGERRVTLVCGTAARLPLPDASTPAVSVQGALHHARPVLAEVLSEIHRILQPGGVLVGSEPANDHPLTHAVRDWQYRHSAMQGNDPDEEGFDRAELGDALRAAGLRLDRYRQFGFIAYPLMGNTDLVPLLRRARSRALGSALLKLDELLERIPGVRGLAWASLYRAFRNE